MRKCLLFPAESRAIPCSIVRWHLNLCSFVNMFFETTILYARNSFLTPYPPPFETSLNDSFKYLHFLICIYPAEWWVSLKTIVLYIYIYIYIHTYKNVVIGSQVEADATKKHMIYILLSLHLTRNCEQFVYIRYLKLLLSIMV